MREQNDVDECPLGARSRELDCANPDVVGEVIGFREPRLKLYRKFGYRNPELYRHYVRLDCLIAHLKALGD